ncbi:hypothetical protein VCUG_01878 [Vavraia culicis subsp. floridensis]|uniref:Uncharacterized protein n=1 Tax=Vavraia culicis (isolate floridensis) TaxID=948595 RepID=L2GTE1_VAVCU|nr:uncharacterized protein VCUG_01878 [Vavraia culicis subsp. floridensis]ELA46652.1 hypothetical protein VCUG_01878 [Vavraia culicis subsp. floridensis]
MTFKIFPFHCKKINVSCSTVILAKKHNVGGNIWIARWNKILHHIEVSYHLNHLKCFSDQNCHQKFSIYTSESCFSKNCYIRNSHLPCDGKEHFGGWMWGYWL